MSDFNLTENHFLFTSASDVNTICKPFFESTKLNHFNYYRFYKDGSFYGLITLIAPVYHHFKQKYIATPNLSEKIRDNEFSYLVSPDLEDSFSQAALDYRTLFNIYYPLYLYERSEDYFDLFIYVHTEDSQNSFNVYFNQMDSIKKFKSYFKMASARLLQQSKKHSLILPAGMQPNIYSYSTAPKKINDFSILSKNPYHLTRREIDCSSHLLNSLSAKQIAMELDISQRTVETHIENMKIKMNARNKYELITKLMNQLRSSG